MTVLSRMQRSVVKGCLVVSLVACARSWYALYSLTAAKYIPEVD